MVEGGEGLVVLVVALESCWIISQNFWISWSPEMVVVVVVTVVVVETGGVVEEEGMPEGEGEGEVQNQPIVSKCGGV